jgi:hypothetical protein
MWKIYSFETSVLLTPTCVGCVGSVLGGLSGCSAKLATNLYVIPKCGKRESRLRYLHFSLVQLLDAGTNLCNLCVNVVAPHEELYRRAR